MRAMTMIAMALLGGVEFVTVVRAGDKTSPTVAVCVGEGVSPNVAEHAQMEASLIFRGIGIRLGWHRADSDFCHERSQQVIQITYSLKTPEEVKPGALAYALPYEGVHLEVFSDRIPGRDDTSRCHALAHILAHEISHILQGTARHSDSGMMKARWDRADLMHMRTAPLTFTEYDVVLIRNGVESRADHDRSRTLLTRSRAGS